MWLQQGWSWALLRRWRLLRTLSELQRPATGSPCSSPALRILGRYWSSSSIPSTSNISCSNAWLPMLSYAKPWSLLWQVCSWWCVWQTPVRSGTTTTSSDSSTERPSTDAVCRRSQADHFTDKIKTKDAVHRGRGAAWLVRPWPLLLSLRWSSTRRVWGSKCIISSPARRLVCNASQGRCNGFHRQWKGSQPRTHLVQFLCVKQDWFWIVNVFRPPSGSFVLCVTRLNW